jgi:hypothetical protein
MGKRKEGEAAKRRREQHTRHRGSFQSQGGFLRVRAGKQDISQTSASCVVVVWERRRKRR